MSRSTVLTETHDAIRTITLDRPEARNAISRTLMREFSAALDAASADDAVRVVILTGAGDAFCAGMDLKEFGQLEESPGNGPRPDCWRSMAACPKPIIGAINGAAITGGFEVALACDVLIAGESARFADTHGRVGVLPGAGLSQRLGRAVGIYRAKYLSLTGNFLSAREAAEWGLVSHVVPDDELMSTARRVAEDMLGLMPHMLPGVKALIDDGFATSFEEGMALEQRRSQQQIAQMKPQQGASAAFEAVRERGRSQKR